MALVELTRKLIEACQDEDEEEVRRLVELGGDPCQILPEQVEALSALRIVTKLGSLKVLRLLVEICQDINLEVRDGRNELTPLHYACLYGHRDVCAYLISCKCDPHSLTINGDTALHLVCRCPSENGLEIIKLLVQLTNCDVNVRNKNGNTPLIVLINQSKEQKNFTIIKFLISNCVCDITFANNDGNTALHLACSLGNISIVELILESISHTFGGCLHDSTLATSETLDCLYVVNELNEIPLETAMKSKANRNDIVILVATEMFKIPDEVGNTPLHLACLQGNFKLAKIISKMPECEPDLTNNDGDTPLHIACRHGSVRLVELLLDLNCDISIVNKTGETSMTIVSTGNSDLLENLFKKKGVLSCFGESPFVIPCEHVNSQTKSLTLDLKWDSNQISKQGTTPILVAFKNGHMDTVKNIISSFNAKKFVSEILLLLERGFDPSLILAELVYSDDLIWVLCGRLGDLNSLKVLAGKIKWDEPDNWGWTALHDACCFGRLDIVKYLVDEQLCSVSNGGTQNKQTPLHLACVANCDSQDRALEIVIYLMTKTQADCNAQTAEGDSPLMILLKKKDGWDKIAFYLIYDCFCNLAIRNKHCETALFIACMKGNAKVITMIILKGYDPSIDNDAGGMPLHIECEMETEICHQIINSSHCTVSIILILLQKSKSQPTLISAIGNSIYLKQDEDGNSPLHVICMNNNIQLARLIVETKCNPNMLNKNGDTPLHIVCDNGNVDIAAILLGLRECNVHVMNECGDTPLHLACRNGFSAIVELLLKRNPNTLMNVNDGGKSPLFEAFSKNVNFGFVLLAKFKIILEQTSVKGNSYTDIFKQLMVEGMHSAHFFQTDTILQHLCGQVGDIEALTYLASYYTGKHFMTKDSNGWTLLHYACSYGHSDIAQYLIEKQNVNSLINAQTSDGETPLHVSCNTQSTEEKALSVIKVLTSNPSCNCNIKDNQGNTPLMTLVYHNSSMFTVASYLIEEFKCDLTFKNTKGYTVCHIACLGVLPNLKVINLLIKAGGNFSTKTFESNNPLHLACKFGNQQMIEILLSLHTFDLYDRNIHSLTPLQIAEENNHIEVVFQLIYAMYDSLDDERNTPLHIACQARNVRLAKIITDMNFNITAANKNGDTPLHFVCRLSSLTIVKLLTQHAGCDYDYRNENGDTPLHVACESGNLIIAQIIMNKCQFHKKRNKAGLTPFHVALQHCNLEIAYLLLDDIEAVQLVAVHDMGDTQDVNGWTPLHYACYYGKLNIVEHLLNDIGSNPNVADHSGITPLQLACYCDGSDELALKVVTYLITVAKCNPGTTVYNSEMLLMHLLKTNYIRLHIMLYLITNSRCDASTFDSNGNTLLHVACTTTSDMKVIKMLVSKYNQLLHVKNCDGNTPLHLACLKQQTSVVSTLLTTQKCELYVTNNNLCTPLQCAKIQNNHEIMLLLIKAMFAVRDKDGNSPLHSVCLKHDYYLAKLIINEKFIVTVQNNDGDTPLHLACRNGHHDLVRLFVKANSGLEVLNKYGNTPLNEACIRCDYEIVKILLQANCSAKNKNEDGDMPIHHASIAGHLPIMKLIIENGGIGLIKEKNLKSFTPLHICFQNNHLTIALFLIYMLVGGEVKASLNIKTLLAEIKQLVKEGLKPSQLLQLQHKQQTFLHIACIEGDTEAVQMLTKSKDCNADILDAYHWTPLHYACVHGHVEIVQHLVSNARSNPRLATPEGYSPLLLVCSSSQCTEEKQSQILKFLTTTAKCNPNETIYNKGDTLLFHLLKTNKVQLGVVNYLISKYKCCLSSKSDNGNTALHIACTREATINTVVIKKIAERGQEYATIKNDDQQTPLHLACQSGHERSVMNLLSYFGKNSGLYERDKFGNIPLFTAFNLSHYIIASMLIIEMSQHRHTFGNTPLHLAAIIENISLVRFIAKSECDASSVNCNGDTALHIACKKQNLELIKAVAEINGDVLVFFNTSLDTPLHITCRLGNAIILNNMLKHCEVFSLNRKELKSLIHVACEYDHTHIVTLLLEMKIDINGRDKNGDTPLHIACKAGNLNTCKLLLDRHCEIDLLNDNGDTALHLVCRHGNNRVYEEVLNRGSDINAKNNDGDTPLLIACKNCNFELCQTILNEPNLKVTATNNAGDNILHVLCRVLNSMQAFQVIQLVLESTRIDPNASNQAGETPIQLTSYPHIIHELVRFGAHPEPVYTSSVQFDVKHPPQPIVKIFIVGNRSVGKSTLTAALQKEIPRLLKVFTPVKKVTGVDEKTAGIIPYDFESKRYGLVTMYDFAGHREFYSSHTVLLQNSIESSPPIILLVVDLRESCQEIKQNVQYWLSFLENQCSPNSRKPHVIIVGSHADILKAREESIKEKEEIIQNFLCFESLNIVGFVSMDCQYSESSSMTKLRQYLTESSKSLRITGNIKFNAHCFLVYLFDKFKEVRAVTVDQIMQQISYEKQDVAASSPLFFLPNNLSVLFNLCNELSDRGHILLLKNVDAPTSSWVVIDKEALLSDVIGTIFAPKGLKQYSEFASNTGVVPLSRLAERFSSYNPFMLMGFLTHLEFCHEISDKEILQLICKQNTESKSTGKQSMKFNDYTTTEVHDQLTGAHQLCTDNSTNALSLSEHTPHLSTETAVCETYLFFPAFVKLDAPDHVICQREASSYAHHCGWILKCLKEEHFFTSRLLEVLLLRLIFSYALDSTTEKQISESELPILQRKCSVWKNGIFWGNNDGVETLVEVQPNNKAIVVVMRCLDNSATLSYLQLRSSVIQKVLTTVSEFCAKVSTTEHLIDPHQTLSYPVIVTKLYYVNEVAALIAKKSSNAVFVVSESGESISLKTLVHFEPYTVLDQRFMVKLFGNDDSSTEYITDSEVSSLARFVLSSEHSEMFTKFFNKYHHDSPSSAQLFQTLKQWRSSCSGTYSCLRQKLDQYSIYRGRNLLVI